MTADFISYTVLLHGQRRQLSLLSHRVCYRRDREEGPLRFTDWITAGIEKKVRFVSQTGLLQGHRKMPTSPHGLDYRRDREDGPLHLTDQTTAGIKRRLPTSSHGQDYRRDRENRPLHFTD